MRSWLVGQMQFDQLKRRDFIALLGSAVVCWPLAAARTQESAPIVWKLPSAYPADNFHSKNLEALANGSDQRRNYGESVCQCVASPGDFN
jgi:hypothetical protein